MNYVNEKKISCNEPTAMPDCLPEPMESVTELMHSTTNVGSAILAMVARLDGHLFGCAPNGGEETQQAAPDCFRSEMAEHRRTLETAATALSRIIDMLGA